MLLGIKTCCSQPKSIVSFRLLREMGWKDEDDEEYVITEDDMKEFKNLSEQVKIS
jgi:hypothetical protein